jgi:hypothetical protein
MVSSKPKGRVPVGKDALQLLFFASTTGQILDRAGQGSSALEGHQKNVRDLSVCAVLPCRQPVQFRSVEMIDRFSQTSRFLWWCIE